MNDRVVVRVPPELFQRVAELPLVLAGERPDERGVCKPLLLAAGMAVLGKVQDAYVVKSEGGTDEAGVRWEPLSAVTLALRRAGKGGRALARERRRLASASPERRAQVEEARRRLAALFRGADPAARNQRRKALRLLRLKRPSMSPGAYREAERLLRGRTRRDVDDLALLGAGALVLRDTGRLFNSLTPAVGTPEQKAEVAPGQITVGSKVPYFDYHQSDRPRGLKRDGTPRLPRRPVIPDEVPASWKEAAVDAVKEALASPAFWTRFLS